MLLKDFLIGSSSLIKKLNPEFISMQKIELSSKLSEKHDRYIADIAMLLKCISRDDKAFYVSVLFSNVDSLKIDQLRFDENGFNIMYVEINDLSNSQMEDISFEIYNYEEDDLHFYCENIIINDPVDCIE